MFNRITALFTAALAFVFSLLPASYGAKNDQTFSDEDLAGLHSLSDYVDYVTEHGAPSMSSDIFLKAARPVTTLRRLLTGKISEPESAAVMDITMCEELTEMCDYICDNSGLDIAMLLQHVPDVNAPAILLRDTLHLDTANMRQEMYRLRDKAFAEDKYSTGVLLYIFAAYFSVIEKVDIYTTPWKDDPSQRVVTLDVTFGDGETQTMYAYIVIDETGHAHSIDELGILKLGFDVDIYDLVLYATVNCWQRKFGFSVLYDAFSHSSPLFNYTTRRFIFDYAGKEWLIQIWKGNYAMITNGAELGVYNRPQGKIGLFYGSASDDEMMPMSIELLHGDEVLFSRPVTLHWWSNCFKFTKTLYLPQTLTMNFTLTFPDAEMLAAFTDAVENEGFGDVDYSVDGLTFSGTW